MLGKLDVSGLQWLTADRGLRAARAAEDPLLTAESQRLVANAARRAGHHDQAQALTLAAAEDLDRSRDEHLAVYGMLLCSAGYAAAIPTTERRARLLVDLATSYHQWGKPDRAYSTLLAAERSTR